MLLVVLLLISGLGIVLARQQFSSVQSTPDPERSLGSTSNLLSAQEFNQILADETVFVLDVHTPEQVHIPRTEAVIAYDQLEEQQDQLPADKATPIAVYCRSGGMSAEAVQTLAKLGYTTVYELAGGLQAYQESNNQVTLWPAVQELGTVIYGDVATTTFTLTNLTPLPVKITRISTSCGCTTAEVAKEQLAAYEQTTVTVRFDPAVHEDDTDVGEITRSIYISTDHPQFERLEAAIEGEVVLQEDI